MHMHEYIDGLERNGYSQIGGGLYSKVFARPNESFCIKVASLDTWPNYIKWSIEEGYSGTFAPKVFSLKFHDDYYVAIMEKLVDTISSLRHLAAAHSIYDRNSVNELYKHAAFHTGYSRYEKPENECEYPDLVEFCEKLRRTGLVDDLHTGNVMFRQDGSIVIIDPSSQQHTVRFRVKWQQITA